MKLKKLDKRHSYYGQWTHMAEFVDPAKFLECRIQCWELFGPSREADTYRVGTPPAFAPDIAAEIRLQYGLNQHWCWEYIKSENRRRIYFREPKDITFITLKWINK